MHINCSAAEPAAERRDGQLLIDMLLHIGADHGKRSCLRAIRFDERFSLYFILPHAQ